MKTLTVCLALGLSLRAVPVALAADAPLVVHEWGTFTCLQDEDGNAIGGINVDDEPAPSFVHRVAYNFVQSSSSVPGIASKGLPARPRADVIMRLETPVIYFHPSADWKPQPVTVQVKYRNGWLSEYYPDADAKTPGLAADLSGTIPSHASGELTWKDLSIGVQGSGPETQDNVWLAPRNVDAATLKNARGETEKFLFYRGVAHANAPMYITRNSANDTLTLHRRDALSILSNGSGSLSDILRIHAAWLVDVRPDGTCAFKSIGAVEWNTSPMMPATFDAKEYSSERMTRLRDEMNKALIAEGLFPDEAQALLNTWQVSYLKSPGLRFFYICPRFDIDNALPLKISVPAKLIRVMIGRIEIVTPEQRSVLGKLSDLYRADRVSNILHGPSLSLTDYSKLGRFRNALVLDEQRRHPTPDLADFIKAFSLGPVESASAQAQVPK